MNRRLTAGSPHGAHSVACGDPKIGEALANGWVSGAFGVLFINNDRFDHFGDPDAPVLSDFTKDKPLVTKFAHFSGSD
ncbi:hypothetical protein [Pandoraea oxalativorans]|uniref:hypothetical protein n=1 Tax=Pandoraea oxalativorans TaxID=573737 RepID=UPI0012F47F9E|nr:hypothetical protein [Pandoraea oxalativorans]